jgi:Domain of Unknown Function (DUF1080)
VVRKRTDLAPQGFWKLAMRPWSTRNALSVLALVLLLGLGTGVRAAKLEPQPKDPEVTDPDFAAQGEYVGKVFIPEGETTIGVQVIALGQGKFSAISYFGGLPGDGWDRGKRREGKGEMKDGTVEIDKGKERYWSEVKDGVLTIFVDGVKFSELKKVHRESVTLGAPPPEGATVLFDGKSTDNFENGKMTEDGLLLPGCTSKQKFGSGRLHLEFRTPFMPEARKLRRGRSGVFLQGRYEVQIVDSFGEKEVNYGCGAIFGLKTPDVNTSYPPGSWQTLDVDFNAAEYEHGRRVKDPYVTVRLNHEIIVRKATLHQATHGAPLAAGPEAGPIVLDDHGDAVRFRNIWYLTDEAEKAVEKARAK